MWGRSSVGRAVALQASGRRFDPVRLHHCRAATMRKQNSEAGKLELVSAFSVARLEKLRLSEAVQKRSRFCVAVSGFAARERGAFDIVN